MQQQVFIQYTPKSHSFLDESFLDLDFAFDPINRHLPQLNFDQDDQPQESVSFEPIDFPSQNNPNSNFFSLQNNQSTLSDPLISEQFQQNQPRQKKSTAKSTKTKNICFNICQKTIKVMKTRIYNKKVQEISSQFGQSSEKVIHRMLKIKKDLTGPKALQMFVEKDDGASKVFRKFMKWFLQEKYLRHAINEGTMQDLKGYLEFKNQVILNLLED